jgi:TolB-like protein
MKRVNRWALLAVLLVLCPLGLFAIPQVAVLDTVLAAGIDPTVATPISDKIIEELINSGKYRVIDRANVERILREKEFQLSSGIVRDEEVRQAGEYLGADYVVIANLSRVGSTFVISAKMIDVVTGEISAQSSSEKKGSIDVVLDVARAVGRQLAGQQIVVVVEVQPPEQKPEAKPAAKQPEKTPAQEVVKKPAAAPRPFKPFVIGVKAGGNLANVSGEDWFIWADYWEYMDASPSSVFGLNAGAYCTLNFSRNIGIQLEALFAQKGYDYYFYDLLSWYIELPDLGYATTSMSLDYLEIPVLLKFSFGGSTSFYGILGGYYALLLGGTVENSYDDSLSQVLFDAAYYNPWDIYDLLSSSDFGLVFGAGMDIRFGSLLLNLEARYSMGLSNVDAMGFWSYSNSVFEFTAGLGLEL